MGLMAKLQKEFGGEESCCTIPSRLIFLKMKIRVELRRNKCK